MGQVYWFHDPPPVFLGVSTNGPCFDHSHGDDGYEDEYIADDGWPDPGPCPIDGVPHTACLGESNI